MFRQIILFSICFVFVSCQNGASNKASVNSSTLDSFNLSDLSAVELDTFSKEEPEIDIHDETKTCYVVIGDTSYLYNQLLKFLILTSKKHHIEIDSMDRFYDSKLNKIRLPDDHHDEIYAGEYFPRRYESGSLSIEYAASFMEGVNDSLFASVLGIYETDIDAKERCDLIRKINPKAFVIKSELFQGCMH